MSDIRTVVASLQPEGQTFVAKPIASLAQVALKEGELEARRIAHEQRIAFSMARHRRLGAHSPARGLPLELIEHIGDFVGPGVVHARVIMAIDGDNNVGCGSQQCAACGEGGTGEEDCPFNGREAVTRAVHRLLQGADGLALHVEMNIAVVGEGAAARDELKALCKATGGRYDSVRDDERSFLAESYQFFHETAMEQKKHVGARYRAVQAYKEMVREGAVNDVGVRTVFKGSDHEIYEKLKEADQKRRQHDEERMALCQRSHGGAPCPHGADRDACLRAVQFALAGQL